MAIHHLIVRKWLLTQIIHLQETLPCQQMRSHQTLMAHLPLFGQVLTGRTTIPYIAIPVLSQK